MTLSLKERKIKRYNQNIIDYVLTNYGNGQDLIKFMLDNDILFLNVFNTDNVTSYKNIISKPNNILDYFFKNNIIVATGKPTTFIDAGDFSLSDFSNDYY